MSTTYTQSWSYIENRERKVSLYANLSDTFDGLFVSGTTVDIFQIENFDKALNREGGAIESELKMSIDSHNCRSATTSAALTFALESSTIANKRFFAVFEDSISYNNIMHYGIINNNYEITDYDWDSALWSGTTTAWRRYGFTIKPYQQSIFESISFNDILDDIDDDAVWKAANVEDRAGYFYDSGTSKYVKYKNLCSFNAAIRKITDVFTSYLASAGFGNVTISYNTCNLPMKFAPARFNLIRGNRGELTRYVITNGIGIDYSFSAQPPYNVYYDDYYQLSIDPEDVLGTNKIYIDYSLLTPQTGEPGIDGSEIITWRKYEYFNEFLQAIANTYDLILNYEWVSDTELEIQFTAIKDIIQANCYISDVTESKLQVTPDNIEVNKDNSVDVDGTLYCSDGEDYFVKSPSEMSLFGGKGWDAPVMSMPSNKKKQTNGEAILSISPSLCVITKGADDLTLSQTVEGGALPANSVFYNNTSKLTKQWQTAPGIHTGMYMYIGKYGNHSTYEPNDFYAPVAACSGNIFGIDKYFTSLKDYAIYRKEQSSKYYAFEKSITVPGIYQFSANSNGSSPSWKNLKLGSQINFDSTVYTVTKIEYDFENYEVAITMATTEAFNIDVANTETNSIPSYMIGSTTSHDNSETSKKTAIAAETISEGSYLAIKNDGTVEIYRSNEAYYGRGVGFALNDALTGELVQYQYKGVYTIPSGYSDLTEGDPVYIVLDLLAPALVNIDQTPLEAENGTLNLFKMAGMANSTRTINMDHQLEGLLK